ncbi:hypothetical protein MVEN_01662800 [Mycena venus]|uniref:Uncharacterized protein n=1 Tax=Mycena venus TaxID=2733690 RepID=A0A8H6XNH4_9AGAR|nr:hypothetical protein MVEN_01662800 [Mycena venus]
MIVRVATVEGNPFFFSPHSMHSWPLLVPFFNIGLVRGLGVILPLRSEPGNNCNAWTGVSTVITAHPNTPFYIVINPDINPQSGDSLPDANYRACIPTLRPSANPNTIVMGYVDTVTASTVIPYMDAYAAWDTSYRPDGIMLDHVSATSSLLDTYKNYTSHVKSAGFTFTALDPAAAADASYFPLVDLINTYEFLYSSFDATSLSDSASTPLSKQSVVLTNAPANDSYSTVISGLASLGVGAVFVTDKGDTDSALPSQLIAFVSEIAKLAPDSSSSFGSPSATVSSPSPTASLALPGSSSTDRSTPRTPHKTKSHISAIIGGVIGAVLFLIGVLLIYVRLRPRKNSSESPDLNSELAVDLDPRLAIATPFEAHAQSPTEQHPTGYSPSISVSGKGRPAVAPSSNPREDPRVPMAQRESFAIPAFPPPSYSDVDTGATGSGSLR